jgi:hypothetical protein
MPLGATFSDLVIDGDTGLPATCPSAPIAPEPSTCDGLAIADATAASWESGVYPDASDLNVEGDGSAPNGIVYLRFAPIAGAVAHATLRLYVATTTSAGGGSGRVCRVNGGSWDESTLTWSTRPTVSSDCVGVSRTLAQGEEIEWDVTPLIAPGDATLAIVSTDPDGVHYVSREAGGCTLGPHLGVELAPSVDGGTSVAPGSDAEIGDAGISRTGAGRGTVAGCGCLASRREQTPWAWMALALALVLATRRRRM